MFKKLLPVFFLLISSCIPAPLLKNKIKKNIVSNGVCSVILMHDSPGEGDYSVLKNTMFKGIESSIIMTRIKEIREGQVIVQQFLQYEGKRSLTETMFPGISNLASEFEYEYHVTPQGRVISAFLIDHATEEMTELKINKDEDCNPTNFSDEPVSNSKEINVSVFNKITKAKIISYQGKNKVYHVAVLSREIPFQLLYSFDLNEKNWKEFIKSKDTEKNRKYGYNFMEIMEYKINGIIYKNSPSP